MRRQRIGWILPVSLLAALLPDQEEQGDQGQHDQGQDGEETARRPVVAPRTLGGVVVAHGCFKPSRYWLGVCPVQRLKARPKLLLSLKPSR